MSNQDWELIFVLPNMIIDKPYEAEYLAIVPFIDKRLRAIRASIQSAKKLLTNFRTVTGNKVEPSALIWRKDAPKSVKQLEAIVAFRNSLAIACLLHNCAVTVNADNVFGPVFSDYFDFSPCTIGKNGSFHISSPALNAYGPKLERFFGSTYPYLSYHKIHTATPDRFIAEKILKKWHERFVSPAKDTWDTRLLFRSLEMAYQALVVPFRNNSTLYEYGTNLALWISAFEILVHKRPGDRVGWNTVNELLGKYRWRIKRLSDKKFMVINNKKENKIIRGNLVQKLYRELYEARCSFLHGNQVKLCQIFPFQNKKRPPLGQLAPSVYWTALSVFIPSEYDEQDMSVETVGKRLAESLNNSAYEEALLAAIGVERDEIYRRGPRRKKINIHDPNDTIGTI